MLQRVHKEREAVMLATFRSDSLKRTQKGLQGTKLVSDGLEKSQQESRKKIFEFGFCLVRGRDSTGVLDFLGMGFSVR